MDVIEFTSDAGGQHAATPPPALLPARGSSVATRPDEHSATAIIPTGHPAWLVPLPTRLWRVAPPRPSRTTTGRSLATFDAAADDQVKADWSRRVDGPCSGFPVLGR